MEEPHVESGPVATEEPSYRPPKEPSLFATSLSVFGVGVALYLLAGMKDDIAYYFSPADPIELGRPDDYHGERAEHDRYGAIVGAPGRAAARYEKFEATALARRRWEIVVVQGTEILVRRAMPGPVLPRPPGQRQPPPDPALFSAAGRLLRDDRAPEFRDAFRILAERGELAPKQHAYLMLDGERPRSAWQTPVGMAILLAFIAANAAALWRAYRPRRPKLPPI